MKNGFETRQLGELLELNESGTWGEEGDKDDFPVLRSSNIHDGKLVLSDVAYRKVSSRDAQRYKLDDGDIIITKSSGSPQLIGKSCLFVNPDGRNYLFSNFTQRLRAIRNVLEPRFLYFFLASPTAKDYLKKISNTTSGLRNLNMRDYGKQPIPLPPLPIQKEIAAILEKADAAREKRRRANQLTELFLQSAFLEMFGDPVTNPKRWKIEEVGAVCKVTKLAGFEYTKHIKYQDAGEIIVIRGLNVKDCRLRLHNVKYIDRKTSDFLIRSKLFKDDIVMTYIGVNIGDVAIINESDKYHLAPNVAKITPFSANVLHPIYLLRFLDLEVNKVQFRKFTTSTAKQALNMSNIRKLSVPVPPIEHQEKFAALVEKVETLRAKQRDSERELNNLFNSLMQRAFKGELVG